MTRILIIAVAVLLVLGGVSTALSRAEDQDPGPAIVLDKDPVDDAKSGQGTATPRARRRQGDDAKHDDEGARVSDDRSDGDDTFTVAHPQPVDAADDEPDDEPEPDEPDDEPDDDRHEPDDEADDEPDDEPDDD